MGKDKPQCAFDKNCKNPLASKSIYCAQHQKEGLKREKLAEEAKLKKEEEEKKKKQLEEEKAEKARLFVKQQEQEKAKKEKIKEIAQEWTKEVNGIVRQVKELRKTHPGANAGKNTGATTITGGTDNPLKLTLPNNPYKITKKEVFDLMGPDSSDSGSAKFRVADGSNPNILVHVE